MRLQCETCGGMFKRGRGGGKTPPRYCSDECRNYEKTCPQCGTVFVGYATKINCSNECHLISIRTPEHQIKAGKAGGKSRMGSGDQSRVLSGGRRIDTGGYVVMQDGKVHEHRVVAEQVLGRKLLRGEVVHHEDLDRTNNAPFNLIVFKSQAAHARHHKLNHLGRPCDCPCLRLGVMQDVL